MDELRGPAAWPVLKEVEGIPQIGRFLSVDPMASAGGQDMLSPYQAMGNDPVSGTDPGGTETGQPGGDLPGPPGDDPPQLTSALFPSVGGPAGGLWQTSINGPLTGFSAAVLNDLAGNVNTDPMDLEGQMSGGDELGAFVMAVLQAGGFLNVITGSQPVSSQIINSLVMSEGNGSGGGASDDAGGDPPSGDGKSDSKSSSQTSVEDQAGENVQLINSSLGDKLSLKFYTSLSSNEDGNFKTTFFNGKLESSSFHIGGHFGQHLI